MTCAWHSRRRRHSTACAGASLETGSAFNRDVDACDEPHDYDRTLSRRAGSGSPVPSVPDAATPSSTTRSAGGSRGWKATAGGAGALTASPEYQHGGRRFVLRASPQALTILIGYHNARSGTWLPSDRTTGSLPIPELPCPSHKRTDIMTSQERSWPGRIVKINQNKIRKGAVTPLNSRRASTTF